METMVARYGSDKKGNAKSADFATYLYSRLTQNASWGMGALQRVSWAGANLSDPGDSAYVPSMVYYGVSTREAIWMRMVGLPREAASRAAAAWTAAGHQEPTSYAQLREFVSGLSADDWNQFARDSAVSGEQMKVLWRELG